MVPLSSDARTTGRVRIRDHASDALGSKVLGLAGLLLAFALGAIASTRAADLARGAQIHAANCAACHGPQGRPDPESPLVKSLGVMPANFVGGFTDDVRVNALPAPYRAVSKR
jgi:H+/Cl- antiporter ClcA